MNVDAEVIERIVARVMEQLQSRPTPVRSAGVGVQAEQTTERKQETTNGVLLSENVITAEVLERQLNGSREIAIGPKSVLTPSARDFLRSRNIKWTRQTTHRANAAAACQWKAIVVRSMPGVAAVLDDVVGSGDAGWQHELVGCSSEAVSTAVSALCRADAAGVVVFAADVQSIACRANRNHHVRAGVVADVQAVETVRRSMGANLIGIDPNGKSYFELRNMLRAVTAGGPPRAPAQWVE